MQECEMRIAQSIPTVKKCVALKKTIVKKDVKSKVASKKQL